MWLAAVASTWASDASFGARIRTTIRSPTTSFDASITVGTLPCQSRKIVPSPNARDQSLAFGDGTIFLLWQGKVPTVLDASKLVVGDRIVVRIRAPKDASLAQVEATAANHIGDREPAKTP